jgi:ribosome biogenesis GTPase A
VSMEHTNVPFTLVLNKCDLVSAEARADWDARLEQARSMSSRWFPCDRVGAVNADS